MTEAWAKTDISVLVSAFEGTSISMLESMGQGCVPVVTKVSGTSKVIQEGVNGFTAEVADLEGLANHIQHLHEDRNLLSRCSKAAFDTIKQNYGHESYLAWLINLGEEIIAEEPRTWPKARPIMQEAKGLKKYAVRAYKSLRQKAVKIKAGLRS